MIVKSKLVENSDLFIARNEGFENKSKQQGTNSCRSSSFEFNNSHKNQRRQKQEQTQKEFKLFPFSRIN